MGPKTNCKKKAVIIGYGPAGYFCALTLAKAGVSVIVIEQGSPADDRADDIAKLERQGQFDPRSNYCNGEGGAGTFSDGKLTSRTKGVNEEKEAVFSVYINAGAPAEIAYLSMPHIGSDNLQKMMPVLRQSLIDLGVQILFGEKVVGLDVTNGICRAVKTEKEIFEADYFIFAQGHSSHETTSILLDAGVGFIAKTFAVGMRAEHSQLWLNKRQWGSESLPGFKAADYRLTASGVYSFCMCPGGHIVPAAASRGQSIVNGMSFFARNGEFCNAAVVATVHPDEFLLRSATARDALDIRKRLDEACFRLKEGFSMPACKIRDFVSGKLGPTLSPTSYPLGIFPHDFSGLYPDWLLARIREGLLDFEKKMPGFMDGQLIGIEPTTSSPLQVIRRQDSHFCADFSNLAVIGEASGFAGGIVSSAVHGIKTARELITHLSSGMG